MELILTQKYITEGARERKHHTQFKHLSVLKVYMLNHIDIVGHTYIRLNCYMLTFVAKCFFSDQIFFYIIAGWLLYSRRLEKLTSADRLAAM